MSNDETGHDVVVVANRLPVDRHIDDTGQSTWKRSPGGLVTALRPVMNSMDGAWVGWSGSADEHLAPFDYEGTRLVPVPLSAAEVTDYYEGFSNGTLWPLYHDVIVPPEYHRTWYDAYHAVNARFAQAAAAQARSGAVVWIHDYQLQLVPSMIRSARPDVKIVFFNHIPFPPPELFSQLPWREGILNGLLGADIVGFQHPTDAYNFRGACARVLDAEVCGDIVHTGGLKDHSCVSEAFPISIDVSARETLASSEETTREVARIRANMGGRKILLGVDRLDYIKGITHRLKAFGELLNEQKITPRDVVLVQVATPSRERVAQYQALRDDIELTVGRLNGDHSTLGRPAVHYLHKSLDAEQMAAVYRVADVLLVTSLRDGMNLVAKEYVASRVDDRGVLVLSEFTGASDELEQALLINPHDIDGTKATILEALSMPEAEQETRMAALRKHVKSHDVQRWASDILSRVGLDLELALVTEALSPKPDDRVQAATVDLTAFRPLLVALDFDGTLAPLVDDRDEASPLPESSEAIRRLAATNGVHVALVSGRGLQSLADRAQPPHNVHLIAGHGAEVDGQPIQLSDDQLKTYAAVQLRFEDIAASHPGANVELKPTAIVLHTRLCDEPVAKDATEAARAVGAKHPGGRTIVGHDVVEVSVATANKGTALVALRDRIGAAACLYIGDDTTDEDAFTHLVEQPSAQADVTIKVGDGPTAASCRLGGPEEVAAVLTAMVEAIAD